MNVDEFDELINTIPRVESDNSIPSMDSINVEDLRNAVERLKKIPTYQDLLKENQELKKQLKEKNKTKIFVEQNLEEAYGDGLYLEHLENKNQKYKEVIDKAKEYINVYAWKEDIIGDMYTVTGKPMVDKYMQLEWDNCKELLDILSEVE